MWFNAFIGRIYRDACASSHFHTYFCKRAASSLNKGGLPSYVEQFIVSKVEFGSLSPILCNFKWEPQFSHKENKSHYHKQHQTAEPQFASGDARAEAVDEEHGYSTVEVVADVTFRSGITIYLDTNVIIMGLKVKKYK